MVFNRLQSKRLESFVRKAVSEQVRSKCGSQLEVIGKEVKQHLKIKPAEVYIQQDVYYTYACEKNDIETPIVKMLQESPVIKGSFASPEAIAHIMTQKFVMYSLLYRQEQELNRQGVYLTRKRCRTGC